MAIETQDHELVDERRQKLSDMLDDVMINILMGLQIEGEIGKQFYLDRACLALGGEEYYQKAFDEFKWTRGVIYGD